MKRPLVPVALLYAGGVLLAEFATLSLAWLLPMAFLLAAAALGWARWRLWLLVPLLALVGMANLTLRTAVLSPRDLRRVMGASVADVTLRGTLCETPTQRVYQHDGEDSWRSVARVEVQAVRWKNSEWQRVSGRVAVSTAGILPPQFFGGQPVEIGGLLRPPEGPLVEGLFDYRAYLKRHGIHYQLKAHSANDWRLLSTNATPPLADRFGAWAKKTLALGLPAEDEPLRLLWAMTLGWQTALTGEVSEPFMRSGTMHVFAISGLHIALIAGILVSLLRVLRMPRGWCGLLVIPLLWAYTGATGWQASAIRSTIMMTVIIAGWSLNRPADLLNSLAAAAFIILLWEPQQLFQASFQLSFFVVLSLALFTPVLDGIRRRILQPDPLLPLELRPTWKRRRDRAVHAVAASFTTSLAAWLGSIPLVACYFHFFTPVSLLANLLVVPMSGAALAANLASLIVGGWWPGLAGLFNHSAWLFMVWMVKVSQWSAELPGACWNVATPSPLTFVFYYAVLICLMAGWLKKPGLRAWVGGGLALLGAAWLWQWTDARAATRLSILPLRGGEAIYFDAPGRGDDLLIDCGNEGSAGFVVKPFLRSQGVNGLNALLLTHGDLRHVGGAELLRANFPIRSAYRSAVSFRSPGYRDVCETLAQPPGVARTVHCGDSVLRWSVLHPETGGHFSQADDNAIVLRGEINGTRVLLLSDLGKPGQNALMEHDADLRADVVVSGLPEQGEPLAEALLDAIQPRLIVITDSESPATARATAKLRSRLAARNVPVLYTREAGGVTIEFRKNHWRVRTARAAPIP